MERIYFICYYSLDDMCFYFYHRGILDVEWTNDFRHATLLTATETVDVTTKCKHDFVIYKRVT